MEDGLVPSFFISGTRISIGVAALKPAGRTNPAEWRDLHCFYKVLNDGKVKMPFYY